MYLQFKCLQIYIYVHIVHSMLTVSRPLISHTPFVCYLEHDLLKSANYYETPRYAVFESPFI